EKYLGCLDEAGKHAAMSMTKSFTGLLAEILIAEGRLDMGSMRMGGLGETPVQFFGGYRKYSHTDALGTPQLRSDGLARAGVLFSF
ncbi:MAG: hypothetical protein R3360_06655, partial [Alphaproteobacteria bacterium]|nr:hypothetical protein [Alphaproteobacteria bacterium]